MNNITPLNISKFGTQFRANTFISYNTNTNKNKKVFFKIIVPNYNNMPYIKKCLDSIISQTFQNFKVIVVDDVSTDNSDKICRIYAKRYPDKIIFHQLKEKGYAGAARNYGLDYLIQSDYILFIDSDDWLYNDNVLQDLHDAILSSNKDVKLVKMPMQHFYGENSKQNYIHDFNEQLTLEYAFYRGCGPGRTCISADLAKCKFKENRRIANDVIWAMRCLDKITEKNILSISFPFAVYNRISITSGTNIIKKYTSSELYIQQMKLLLSDLRAETFNSKRVKNIQNKLITIYSASYENCKEKQNTNINLNSISIEQFFRNSYVISINEDKLQLFKKVFQHYFPGFPIPKYHKGSTDIKLTGPQNCTKSHYDIILNAKKHKLPFVMIFEDDAYPCQNALSKFNEYIKYIPNDTKLLILGWSDHKRQRNCYKTQTFQNPINKIINRINGSHAYILFETGYDDYLNFIDNNKNATADGDVFLYLQPSYILDTAIFIQYSTNHSMNGHIGYIYYGDHDEPPKGFNPIQTVDPSIISGKSVKISVITPFYNTQNFVDTYFKTLTSQTLFNEIEILCIDDNSTDNTYSKILEYSNKFPNVKVFKNEKNMGSGFSRNIGLDNANGEFIAFLDSDDFYPSNDSLERLYKYGIRTNTNICGGKITPVKIVNGKYQQLKPFFEKDTNYELNKIMSFDDFQYIYYFTRYIYRRSFLNKNNIRFKNYKRFQDPVFLYDAMTAAKVFYAIGYSTYCFTANDHWKNLSNEQEYDRLLAIKDLLNTVPKKYIKLCNFLIQLVVDKIDSVIEKSKDNKFNSLLKTFINIANEKKPILTKENLTKLQIISNERH